MTLGQAISRARKQRGMKMEALGNAVGKSLAALSGYENDSRVPDADTVEAIAKELDANEVRLAYLRSNPVYCSIIPRVFSDLNNIRRDPAVVFTRLAKEADEARVAALELAELFSNMNPTDQPDFWERFDGLMEQVLDAKRAAEIAEVELLHAGVLTVDRQKGLYCRQQQKCVRKGHHVESRTGTEG